MNPPCCGAGHKWFARLLVAEIIIRTLDQMELRAPVMSLDEKRHLAAVRRTLAGPVRKTRSGA